MSELETLEAEAKLVRSRRDNFRHHAQALRNKAQKATAQANDIDTKADKETIYLGVLEAKLAEMRAVSALPAKPPRPRCEPPCGKRKYDSASAAREGTKTNGHRMRVYWADDCRCWHAAKVTT